MTEITAAAEKQLNILIERRYRKGEVGPDELEPSYMESGRWYNTRRREENRLAWQSYFCRLAGMDAAELVELIACSKAEGALSPNIARLEVMRAIYNREPSMLHMELPDERFEAGARLRRLFGAMPPEKVALWLAEWDAREKEGATDEELRQLDDNHWVPYGITAELEGRALGPDRGEISEAEKRWRIEEHVHDVLASPWGWEFHKHASELES